MVREMIHSRVLAEFGADFVTSIEQIRTIEKPARFAGPIFLAVISLKVQAKDIATTLSKADPEDVSQLQKHLEEDEEVTIVFSKSGEELERHFRGMDYFFDHRKIEV